ncbi:MAG: 2-oxo acid dehydrogenase subunit E2 [Candidatus Dasytiphilus stammeri]
MLLEIKVPNIGIEELQVTEIRIKSGEIIENEQPLITVEGDKALIEIPSTEKGIVKEVKVTIGDKITSGDVIIIIDSIADEISTAVDTINQKFFEAENQEVINDRLIIHATPLIRRLAHKLCIDLSQIKGSGLKNRILKEDINTYVRKIMQSKDKPASVLPQVEFSKFGKTEIIKIGKINRISARNLLRNSISIPHVTQHDEADITELENFRRQQNKDLQHNDINITPLGFVIKAVTKALEIFPYFNSSISENGEELTIKKYTNIGLAVDTPNGLLVPVIYNANQKNIIELSREIKFIAHKARNGELKLAEMQGSCFTISSIGNIGGSFFTPIINAPEVAILGISKSLTKPLWNGKKFIPRIILPLSLSYDHRVIDGAAGARFITYISKIMADIRHLLM